MTTTDTDWVKPGAAVVVYHHGNQGDTSPKKTKVKGRAAKSFTVEGFDERFKLDTCRTKDNGGIWNINYYVAVPADSDEARRVIARHNRDAKMSRARAAVDLWERYRTRENRLAAIEALQAVED